MGKVRADQLLVDRGLVESRTRAQALILAGLVYHGEKKVDKAGQALPEDAPLDVPPRKRQKGCNPPPAFRHRHEETP